MLPFVAGTLAVCVAAVGTAIALLPAEVPAGTSPSTTVPSVAAGAGASTSLRAGSAAPSAGTPSTVTVPTVQTSQGVAPVVVTAPVPGPTGGAHPSGGATPTVRDGGAKKATSSADTLPAGAWVTVLESLEQPKTSLAEARATASQVSAEGGRPVYVLDSTRTPPLVPGYWAVVAGPHASEADALANCAIFGRSVGEECYARHLS